MNLIERTLWAELKFKILESALMISEGYTDEDVIVNLLKIVELLENTNPQGSD